MGLNFKERAAENFRRSCESMDSAFAAMLAEHSATGNLRSGATIKKTLAIFEEETRKALAQSLDEMAKHIEHCGGAWKQAVSAIGNALDDHLAGSQQILKKPLSMTGPNRDNAQAQAVEGRLTEIADRLRAQLNEFSNGWTAPRAKPWKELHPNLDRIIFLVIGAVNATALALIAEAF